MYIFVYIQKQDNGFSDCLVEHDLVNIVIMLNCNHVRKIQHMILMIILITIAAICSLTLYSYASSQKVVKTTIHKPDESTRKKWEYIENILITKDNQTILSIDTLLATLVEQENNVTDLLEQKASTQMSCIAIVIAIVLASLGLFMKDLPSVISRRSKNILVIITILIIGTFIFSMYWSYKGFVIRENYAAYNVDGLFGILEDKDSNYLTYQISNILENYQIYFINSTVNEVKADALSLALKSFIIGIIGFSFVSLGIIIFTNKKEG